MEHNILYLNSCILCLKDGLVLCDECFNKYIEVNTPRRCSACNAEVYSGFLHTDCKEYSYLDGLIYLTDYSELVQKLLHLGKYSGSYRFFKEFGSRISQIRGSEIIQNRSLITSVPIHRVRFIERGFNQADVLAFSLAKSLKTVYLELLNRKKNSKKQFLLNRVSRAENLADLFQLKSKSLNLQSFDQIYICDDVYTTGKTLNECAKTLKQVYRGSVYGVVIAKA